MNARWYYQGVPVFLMKTVVWNSSPSHSAQARQPSHHDGTNRRRCAGRDSLAILRLIREAVNRYLRETKPRRSAYDMFKEAGLIGCIRGGPKDLATNPKYMEGFGE